jgi:hypothetical protein
MDFTKSSVVFFTPFRQIQIRPRPLPSTSLSIHYTGIFSIVLLYSFSFWIYISRRSVLIYTSMILSVIQWHVSSDYLFTCPEDGGKLFLRNVGTHLPNYVLVTSCKMEILRRCQNLKADIASCTCKRLSHLPWRWRQYISPKRKYPCTKMYCISSYNPRRRLF